MLFSVAEVLCYSIFELNINKDKNSINMKKLSFLENVKDRTDRQAERPDLISHISLGQDQVQLSFYLQYYMLPLHLSVVPLLPSARWQASK